MLSYLLHRDILKYFEQVQQCCIFVRFMAWLHVSKAGFCTSVSNKFAIGFRMALREKYIILSRKCFNDIRITSNRSFFFILCSSEITDYCVYDRYLCWYIVTQCDILEDFRVTLYSEISKMWRNVTCVLYSAHFWARKYCMCTGCFVT